MDRTVQVAIDKLQALQHSVQAGKHVVTGNIRKVSLELYRDLQDKSINNVFSICEELLEMRQ